MAWSIVRGVGALSARSIRDATHPATPNEFWVASTSVRRVPVSCEADFFQGHLMPTPCQEPAVGYLGERG